MDPDLNDHVVVLRKRWRVLAVMLVAGTVFGLSVSLSMPILYTATATVRVSTSGAGEGESVDPEQLTTLAEVVLSDDVVRRVRENLGVTAPTPLTESTTVEPVDGTTLMTISSTDTTARGAARVADAFAQGFIEHQAKQAVRRQEAVQKAYREQLGALDAELDDRRTALPDLRRRARREAKTEIDSLMTRRADLQTEMLLAASSAVTGLQADILKGAAVPTRPSQPQPVRGGVFGAVLGLILGAALAFARDRQDDVIRTDEQVTALIPGVPLLGKIPPAASHGRDEVTALTDHHSPASEAYRATTTNLRFLLRARGRATSVRGERGTGQGRAVMITSAAPGEGKTSVATNIAVTAAALGVRVVLVDADLRAGLVAERFYLPELPGLSDVLVGDDPVDAYLRCGEVKGLEILPAGTRPPNPTELLASPRARQVWRALRARADLVIVDAPPLLSAADSLQLMSDVDDVVFVVRQGHTRVRQIRATLQRIQPAGDVTGVVLNDVRDKVLSGAEAGYRAGGYGPAAEGDARDA
jgi:capsular exopolysaccharide synthesis family protein